MPMYVFRCRKCSDEREYLFSMKERPETLACAGCGGQANFLPRFAGLVRGPRKRLRTLDQSSTPDAKTKQAPTSIAELMSESRGFGSPFSVGSAVTGNLTVVDSTFHGGPVRVDAGSDAHITLVDNSISGTRAAIENNDEARITARRNRHRVGKRGPKQGMG